MFWKVDNLETETMVVRRHVIFMKASEGPFRCDNCTFSNEDASRCSHPDIIKLNGGIIEPGDCSDFFNSKKGQANGETSLQS